MWGIIQKKDTHTLEIDVTLPFGLKQLIWLIFRFAKGFLAKVVLLTAQRDFVLGNSLSDPDCEHLAGDIKISLFLPVLSRYESELL
jgi:hypothetical protein